MTMECSRIVQLRASGPPQVMLVAPRQVPGPMLGGALHHDTGDVCVFEASLKRSSP